MIRRPVPTIGDRTAASERAADPSGWAFDAGTRAALREVMAARRDIRRYRPDEVPPELVTELLAAGHAAPSVGHSQPWRFIVVTDQRTRDHAALLSDRERLRQAELLAPDRRARLLDLQLEGIREAPIGIVVACDRRAPAAGVLGRASFPDADLWSCAAAIENIWLTARAAGLGIGWVTLFRPDELAGLLGLPDGVATLGWLCLGWPDERPPEPGLQRFGWSSKADLDQVVFAERWPGADQVPPPSYLAGPARAAVVEARDGGDRLLSAPGSLGVLDQAVNRLIACGHAEATTGTLVVVAGRHPVTRHGVSAYPDSVTDDVVAATRAGTSVGASTARAAGLSVTVEWALPQHEQGDLVEADALTAADVRRLLARGRDLGRMAAACGPVCLGEVGVGNTTVAAALAGALLGADPAELIGLGTGSDTAMLQRKRDAVGAAYRRASHSHPELAEPHTALAALGGPEFAVLAGVVLGAVEAGAPVILDGFATGVAALAAIRIAPAAQAYLVAGQRSREHGHQLVLTELGLEPLLDLRLRAGEGVGACLATQLLLSGLAIRRTTAQVDH